MDPKQVKRLFINFVDDKFDLYGLPVELISVRYVKDSKKYYFYFGISNPNDISYYQGSFEWEIEEILKEFKKYVDIQTEFIVDFVDDQGGLYFNKEKTKEIEVAFKKVDTLKFTLSSIFKEPDRYMIKIKSVGYKKEYDHENIVLSNVIKPISATKNDEPCDVDDAIFQYYEEFIPQQETYWETETLFVHLDQILGSIPSVKDNDMVLEYNTTLFHE